MTNQTTAARPPVRQQNTPKAPTWSLTGSGWLARIAKNPSTPIAVALVVSCIVMSLLSSKFFTAANVTNIVTQSAIVGIAAVGATFVIITSGIDLAVGSTIALSGMIGATLVHNGVDGFLGVLIIVVVASLIGAFNGFSITVLGLAPFIVTLAVLGMGRGLTLQLSQGQSVYGLPPSLTWIGSGSLLGLQLPAVLTIFVFVVGHLTLTRTTLGHQIFAVGGNREAARLSGIKDNRVLFIVYIIAGLCAGLSSLILVGRLGSATPTAGAGVELQVIAAVVIGGASLFGGKGSMLGTFIGVLLIGVINNGLTLLNVSPFWVQFMQGAIIFIAVLLDAINSRRLSRR
jgi:ribose transport system permease protein